MTQLNPKHKSTLDIFDTVLDSLSTRTSIPNYPTGIEELDNLIWGVHKKELLIIGARPSHGKTSLSLQISWNLAKKGIGVIFNSLEMSQENIIERICCSEFDINGFLLRKGSPQEIEKFKINSDKMRGRIIASTFEIVDYKGRSIKETEEILIEFKPEVLVIDHAQKISSKGYSSKYEALADFVNRLQDFAIKYNCAIILNSQINRSGDYLKGAGDLEESADTLLFCNWVCRDDSEHEDKKEYEIQVMKQRHGAIDNAKINFEAQYYKFTSRDKYA